ncbi:MAG: hypothetical protein HQ567_21595 [Candidatus Nealsonbacteria bacterium]|nr:hypothetical protein [Candidatus Nealsonbacteria bacterium]
MATARVVLALLLGATVARAAQPDVATVRAAVEIEEDVYSYRPADNGAGPMWCSGSTCLVRIGGDVFASGLETLDDAKPLNNCRWTLFKRGQGGWHLQQADSAGRTREPCPMVGFPDGRLLMSVNPTLVDDRNAYSGPARPEILRFAAADAKQPPKTMLPQWQAAPPFTEHSYRSFAADGVRSELILFQNIGYTHAQWAFRDKDGNWPAAGQLKWPWGAEYDKPQPVRICYPNVALKDRAVHFCGVSDIIEPYTKWRAYKKEITGRGWDYDFRRLFYTWTDDVTSEKFHEWVEIASRDKTCGWISPGDLWAAPDGRVHILWTDRATDLRLREKFFPQVKQTHALNYAIVRRGKVISQRTLAEGGEGLSGEIPRQARFQVTPEGRLFVFYYVSGRDAAGKPLSENRLIELFDDGTAGPPVLVPLKHPFSSFFTTTIRAGSPASNTIELLGVRAGASSTISYARIELTRG